MRIAQIAPLAESVPPRLYGGTERVIAWLIEELIEMRHDVTLFASGDSKTRAKLVPVCPRALRLGRPRSDPMAAQAGQLSDLAEHAAEFDVIHCHIEWLHLALLARHRVPFVTTLHGRLDLAGLPDIVRRHPEAPFISVSDDQRRPLPGARWLSTIHHGLPERSVRPSFSQGNYLAFLGRLTADKGPEAAIRIARRAGMQLRMAAKVPHGEREYFKERLEPLIDGDQVRLTGEVDDVAKERFLAEAAALLFPIDWPEPFGLVMIEAMACGTPVIAFRRGSVPEVIDEAESGFIVDNEDEAVGAVRRLGDVDRRRVRAVFERRFTAARMAAEYMKVYDLLANGRRGQLEVSPPNRRSTERA